jgi:hypothetical protein
MVQQSSMVNTCERRPKAALVDTPIVTENTNLAGGSLAGVMVMTLLRVNCERFPGALRC